MGLPDKEQIKKAKQETPWDFSNKILYDLCRNNDLHNKDEIILTKVLFIGRIYAAAVERRRNKKDEINDDFYIKTIIPTFKKSELDRHLEKLKNFDKITISNIPDILEAHHYLTSILKNITKLNKRSFSSKYLHFHLPELFFMFDNRVVTALRQFISRIPEDLKHVMKLKNIDNEYANFFCKCFDLKRQMENYYNMTLSNRQFDNLLIKIANQQNNA